MRTSRLLLVWSVLALAGCSEESAPSLYLGVRSEVLIDQVQISVRGGDGLIYDMSPFDLDPGRPITDEPYYILIDLDRDKAGSVLVHLVGSMKGLARSVATRGYEVKGAVEDEDVMLLELLIDRDGDTFPPCAPGAICELADCDDNNPAVHPFGVEICGNGLDDDCVGGDEPCILVDNDGDTYPADVDCDDDNPAIHPGAPEVCHDGLDNNCDGLIDLEDLPSCGDKDGDGYYAIAVGGDDCNDDDPAIHPGAEEMDGDDVDSNCDGQLDNAIVTDYDNDGHLRGEMDDAVYSSLRIFVCDLAALDPVPGGDDCNDFDASVYPGAPEICNDGKDNNCDGLVDQADPVSCPANDMDKDGYQAAELGGDDCNDQDPTIHPNAPEICGDGIDQDCSRGDVDCSTDLDGDGFLAPADCDDTDSQIHPYQEEFCDGVDNDCDGQVDEGNPKTAYPTDPYDVGGGSVCGKAVGNCCQGITVCYLGSTLCVGQVAERPEVCDCADNDCDGLMDEEGDCCTAGEVGYDSCPKCGWRERRCTIGCAWGAWSECHDQGQCDPADDPLQETCGRCGHRSMACLDSCLWGPWSPCQDEGVCWPGSAEVDRCEECGQHARTCTDSCLWSPWGECEDKPCQVGDELTQACGNCGVKRALCLDSGCWGDWGLCEGEGCAPGAVFADPECPRCGWRDCGEDCTWSAECYGLLECEPGTSRPQDCGSCGMGAQWALCSEECQWPRLPGGDIAWGECGWPAPGYCNPDHMDECEYCDPDVFQTQEVACAPEYCNKGVQYINCQGDCSKATTGCNVPEGLCLKGSTETRACELTQGECSEGRRTRTCNDSCLWTQWSDCSVQATDEVCDDLDNDCDGQVDEGLPIACARDEDCVDNDPNTNDFCERPGECEASCLNVPCEREEIDCFAYTDCDDHDPTTRDNCINAGTCEAYCSNAPCAIACTQDQDCSDNNPRTFNYCLNGGTCDAACSNPACPVACEDNEGCNDGNPRTWDECHDGGTCVALCNNPACTVECEDVGDCDDQNITTFNYCDDPGTCIAECRNPPCPIACRADGDCDDQDNSTEDRCRNPGGCESWCDHIECYGDIACFDHEDCDDHSLLSTDTCIDGSTCQAWCDYDFCPSECQRDADCTAGGGGTTGQCLGIGTCESYCHYCLNLGVSCASSELGCCDGLPCCGNGHCSDVCSEHADASHNFCGDGLDNDRDGLTDCADSECLGKACGLNGRICGGDKKCSCPGGETTEITCHDGLDNDCNGLDDCDDPSCASRNCGPNGMTCSNGACTCALGQSPELDCEDNKDNDCDGLVDCLDGECAGQTCGDNNLHCINFICACPGGQTQESTCNDGQDNDCNGQIDCDDRACNGLPCDALGRICQSDACTCPGGASESHCFDGVDNDCDGLLDCLDDNCNGHSCGTNGQVCSGNSCTCPLGAEEICHDGHDNDCDGLNNCADPDCAGHPCGANGLVCDEGACSCQGGPIEAICDDGLDNDCNGYIDCLDPDCNNETCGPNGLICLAGLCACPGGDLTEDCGDGVDNDCNGDIDCADGACTGESCGDHGLICQTGACICPGGQINEASCGDDMDNDCDGLVDCADVEDCEGQRCHGSNVCTGGVCP